MAQLWVVEDGVGRLVILRSRVLGLGQEQPVVSHKRQSGISWKRSFVEFNQRFRLAINGSSRDQSIRFLFRNCQFAVPNIRNCWLVKKPTSATVHRAMKTVINRCRRTSATAMLTSTVSPIQECPQQVQQQMPCW